MLITHFTNAKSFLLSHTSKSNSFSLEINCLKDGQAAFAQYKSQKGYMILNLRKFTTSVLTNTNRQPEGYYYQWDELIGKTVNGRYGIVEQLGKITDAWYICIRDGKQYKLTGTVTNAAIDQTQKLLLHNVKITFAYTGLDSQFMFSYPDGKVSSPNFSSLDAEGLARSCYIKDYNFDGYDDIAFSIADAGMGVYQNFDIWLYEPNTKRFGPLKESQDPRAKCSGLCEVSINARQKLFFTACRGGARWWQDVYRFGKNNQLIWLRSSEKK